MYRQAVLSAAAAALGHSTRNLNVERGSTSQLRRFPAKRQVSWLLGSHTAGGSLLVTP